MTKKQIQKAIDNYIATGGSPDAILEGLEGAMYEVAHHIQEDWQGDRQANLWIKAGRRIAELRERLSHLW